MTGPEVPSSHATLRSCRMDHSPRVWEALTTSLCSAGLWEYRARQHGPCTLGAHSPAEQQEITHSVIGVSPESTADRLGVLAQSEVGKAFWRRWYLS